MPTLNEMTYYLMCKCIVEISYNGLIKCPQGCIFFLYPGTNWLEFYFLDHGSLFLRQNNAKIYFLFPQTFKTPMLSY